MTETVLYRPADPTRIDTQSAVDLRYWAREIGRSPVQLSQAVAAVGPLVADVREFLQRRGLYKLR